MASKNAPTVTPRSAMKNSFKEAKQRAKKARDKQETSANHPRKLKIIVLFIW